MKRRLQRTRVTIVTPVTLADWDMISRTNLSKLAMATRITAGKSKFTARATTEQMLIVQLDQSRRSCSPARDVLPAFYSASFSLKSEHA